jgi:pimeloyl-ACP methyl ester carboxylesterase
MYLAAGALLGRIVRLVLNDIGPEVPADALQRIAAYVGRPPTFDSLAAYEQWLRTNYAPFGSLADATWRHLAVTSQRRMDDGRFTVHYDPQIVQQLTSGVGRVDWWAAYDAIRCPTLLLRGESSDVLAAATAEAMTTRGPKCRLETVAGCGHAPLLDVPHQMALVEAFLAA